MTTTEFRDNNPSLQRYSSADIGRVLNKLGYKIKSVRENGEARKLRLLPYKEWNKSRQIYGN